MGLDSVLSRARLCGMRLCRRTRGISLSAFVHYTAEVCEFLSGQIRVEPDVVVGKHCWLNVPAMTDPDVLKIRRGARIGRNSVISARNGIEIGEFVMTGPQVLIMDHAHEYSCVATPIRDQGVTEGGKIVIEPGCWIGFGAVVVCNRGVLTIGRNSVVGANSVVTQSVPPCSVVAGIPARLVRKYDATVDEWMRVVDMGITGCSPIPRE